MEQKEKQQKEDSEWIELDASKFSHEKLIAGLKPDDMVLLKPILSEIDARFYSPHVSAVGWVPKMNSYLGQWNILGSFFGIKDYAHLIKDDTSFVFHISLIDKIKVRANSPLINKDLSLSKDLDKDLSKSLDIADLMEVIKRKELENEDRLKQAIESFSKKLIQLTLIKYKLNDF